MAALLEKELPKRAESGINADSSASTLIAGISSGDVTILLPARKLQGDDVASTLMEFWSSESSVHPRSIAYMMRTPR